MSIRASQQSLGRKISPADLLWAFPSPHQTILAMGMVGLDLVLMWLVNDCEAGRSTFAVSASQVQIQKLYDVNFKIIMFVYNNQAPTIT
jgi:hypothetical protein